MIQMYIFKDNIKNNALEINDQMYNVKDKAGLSEEIFEALKDLEYYEIPYDYKWDLALKNGDVLEVGGKIYNLEKLEGFIKTFKGNKVFESDMIRITDYTKESDAFISVLTPSKEGVKLITDNTRDKWSAAERRKRVEHKVVDIIQEDIFDGVGYVAITDKGERTLLFHVSSE